MARLLWCDGALWFLFQAVPKSTSRDCRLPPISRRAPPRRTPQRMEAPRTFPTRSRMTLLRRWVSSLKPPLLLGALSSPPLTWPRPSRTGFNLKTTHRGPAHLHLLKKQVGQVGGYEGSGLGLCSSGMLFHARCVRLPGFHLTCSRALKHWSHRRE